MSDKSNKLMHRFKIIGSLLLMVGYGGYGGFYISGNLSDFYKLLWGGVVIAGFIMIWVTSKDYYKEKEYNRNLMILDLCMVFSIFLLPNLLPFSKFINIVISNIMSCLFIYILNFKYWNSRWK